MFKLMQRYKRKFKILLIIKKREISKISHNPLNQKKILLYKIMI